MLIPSVLKDINCVFYYLGQSLTKILRKTATQPIYCIQSMLNPPSPLKSMLTLCKKSDNVMVRTSPSIGTLRRMLRTRHNIDLWGGGAFFRKFNRSQYILLMIVWDTIFIQCSNCIVWDPCTV